MDGSDIGRTDCDVGGVPSADAPAFGIPFGARHISVQVELPDNFPVRHEPYRRFVQYAGGDQSQVEVEDFADIVFRHRPGWLIEIINSLAPKSSASTDDLRKELQDLLNELRVKARSPRLATGGVEIVDQGDGRGATPRLADGSGGGGGHAPIAPTDLVFNQAGAKRATISKNMEQAPEIILLRNEDDIAEKEISGKAARYFRETNQLFVNLRYSAVAAAEEDLELRYATYEDPQMVRELARQWAERLITGRVGYAVVYAQAKQLIREWTSDDVKKALEPESLESGRRRLARRSEQCIPRHGPSPRHLVIKGERRGGKRGTTGLGLSASARCGPSAASDMFEQTCPPIPDPPETLAAFDGLKLVSWQCPLRCKGAPHTAFEEGRWVVGGVAECHRMGNGEG